MMIFAWQFQSPGPILFEVGNFAIRWYGLLIAIAVLIGVNLSQFLAKRRGIKPELLADYVIWGIIGAIPCARLYYVLFQWRSYADRPQDIIAIWQGGIAIHGAILGGVIAALIFCRLNRLSFWQLGDLIAPALILGQAIGRWGNFFNSEAFGAPTDLPWKLYIPLQNRPLNLVEYEYFHPTFLYESVWNLGVFALLLYLFFWGLRHGDRLKTGTIFLAYWIAYSAGRVWIEGLRTDSLMLGGIRVAQLVSLTGMALGILGLVWLYVLKRRLPDVRSPRELRGAEAIPENSET
ncbi:prolipoprotein diacylglyceryl transferase [Synechococcus sp. 7002]|uniref:prolipoprotein diacylglyceryl transferase n=2 Tax=Cyanophyceae TaxID=3028117 RepID=UPI00016DC9B9|nr:prolipoprotein diacylglyceryl transferase [Synechococcus sp. 7002]ACA99553.1 prolipoprotein diacylglyceryl transferase [Picosynechococcus sp. PCC 7002]SMH29829.1 Prolipoprotein diacylglyceryl transferase [Picosynechococcus sp. OG1]SMQ83774.1 Prolipoprotein diacylglyceryl transferase [Synechococcus sp. 7002]